MKIAITTVGENLEAAVDPRFGRAKTFLVYDDQTEQIELIPNTQNLQAAQGAGVQAAQQITDSGVQVLITGNVGPKAFSVLQTAGIKVYTGLSGTVREAIEAYKEGKLMETGAATKPGHWM